MGFILREREKKKRKKETMSTLPAVVHSGAHFLGIAKLDIKNLF